MLVPKRIVFNRETSEVASVAFARDVEAKRILFRWMCPYLSVGGRLRSRGRIP